MPINNTITQEAIERFKCNHLQEIRAVCELTEWAVKRGIDNGKIKERLEDADVWFEAEDIAQNALNIIEAFGNEPCTDTEYYILEGVVHDCAHKYLEAHGIVLD